jgi:hypothetical protein
MDSFRPSTATSSALASRLWKVSRKKAPENFSRDEARTSRVPSWACSSRSFLLHPGLSTSSALHLFCQARRHQPTGGCQHSRCTRRTLLPSTHGGSFLRLPALPLPPAVKLDLPSGAPWEPWALRPFSCHHQLLPSASHTARRARTRRAQAHMRQAQARTRRVRTTARPRHRHRFQPFLCRASWPSNAGQAPCMEASAASDGTQDLHHSTPPSHKWHGADAVVHSSDLCRWREPRTWPVPQFYPLMHRLPVHQPCNARHETNAIFTTWCLNKQTSSSTNQHGTAFIIDFLASVIFSSLLVHVPLIPALWLVFPFFERAIFVLFFSLFIHCTTRPDQVFSLLNTASLGGMHVGHFNGRR